MKEIIYISPEQVEQIATGETVEIVPAKEGYQIAIDTNQDDLLVAEYVQA